MPTLANEFISRYHQLLRDNKAHQTALRVMEGEFNFKIEIDCTVSPTYFFIDGSVADWSCKKRCWDCFEQNNEQ